MPYTTVVAGTTITASWANANIRDQVVTPFASAAARTSAISSPVAGMFSYRSDGPIFEGYDGAGHVPAARFHRLVVKTVLETVTSNTTFQDDDHLVVPLAANAGYILRLVFLYSASTTGQLKTQFTAPAGAAGNLWATAIGASVTGAAQMASLTATAGFAGNGSEAHGEINGRITTGGTAGNLQLQWAQLASHGTGTTLWPGSYMEIQRTS